MTQRQMDEAKMSLPSRMEYRNWTDEQKRLDEELSCRSMINSCLCYGGISGFWAESKWRFGPDKSYAAPHVRKLGLDRVKELVAEQEADFSRHV